MQELTVERRIGGAGTGKTAFVLDQMDRIRSERGLDTSQMACLTFSKSGCSEMRERAAGRWGVSPRSLTNFRTMHSLAYRSLGVKKDLLLTDDAASLMWIGDHLGIDLSSADDSPLGYRRHRSATEGTDEEVALAIWDLARTTLRPVAEIFAERLEAGEHIPDPDVLKYIVERYETAKRLHGRKDFCDILLEFAGITMTYSGAQRCRPLGALPEGLEAVFVDECQDNSAIVDRAIRRLVEGSRVKHVLLAGDPMQSIFEGFAGGSAEHFMQWQASQTVMPKSFRCPASILAMGERCLQEMNYGYWDRGIMPADHAGVVTQAGSPQDAVEEHVDLTKRTLVVSRCGYTLQEYADVLRDYGIPYAWVGSDLDSDLVAFSTLRKVSAGGVITGEDWKATIARLPTTHRSVGPVLRRGEKAAWQNGEREHLDLLRAEDLELAGCTAEFAAVVRQGRSRDVLPVAVQEKFQRWEDEAGRHGVEHVMNPPVRLSTIHAAKGLEADTVLLSTQSSRRVEQGRDLSPKRHDVECRLNYVAVTRAREKLVVVEDGTRERLTLPW